MFFINITIKHQFARSVPYMSADLANRCYFFYNFEVEKYILPLSVAKTLISQFSLLANSGLFPKYKVYFPAFCEIMCIKR
jgi:hypothetical protein